MTDFSMFNFSNALTSHLKGEISCEEFFRGLPDESTAEFQLAITRYVEHKGPQVVNDCESILENMGIESQVRYSAFVALATYFRRVKDISRSASLFDRHRNLFEKLKSFPLFESLHLMILGGKDSVREAFRISSTCLERLPSHTGVVAAHADILCNCWDLGIVSDQQLLLESADNMRAAKRSRPDYARYSYLLGKLMLRLGRFEDAEELIMRAIDQEDSSRPTYVIRIGEYQLEHLRLTLIRSDQKIADAVFSQEKRLKDFHSELQSTTATARSESILLLGLFAGILGVAVSTVQLTSRLSPASSAYLIVTMTGALIVAYSCLAITIQPWNSIKKAVFTLVIGFIVISFGIYCTVITPSNDGAARTANGGGSGKTSSP